MTHHKIMGLIAGLGLFIACATLKRAAHDEAQCIAPTLSAVQACMTLNPVSMCPALASWYQCLANADAANKPVTVKLATADGGGAH